MAADASTIAFDTLKAVRRLKGAGMARGHAEAVAETVAAAQGGAATKEDIRRLEDKMATMATKEDLAKLEATTKADIARLEMATKESIANLEIRLVRVMSVQAGAIIAIIVALLKFLQ